MPKSIRQTINKLEQVAKDCSKKDWDGYEAEPIDPRIVKFAKKFLEYMDSNVPDVFPTNEGGIEIAWGNEIVSLEIMGEDDELGDPDAMKCFLYFLEEWEDK